ncbi:MAG TPA: transcriptional regulator NanR [Dongiaceae bacterium]|jgi:GntR family transcriptional repressor for pyruvate dehydrogenase complex|nr:transcriptional regulator NanR [Dongiaceae bacterium]
MAISALKTTVRRRRLYEDVASALEATIREGALSPGDPLPSERELTVQFGVGRTAVREALFHLQKMGLIELKSGERAKVRHPSPEVVFEGLAGAARHMLAQPDGVRQFQDARTFFEVGLARHAAKHATASDLRDLAAALEANRQSIGDLARFERTDVAFHYVLALIPRNPIFTAFHSAIAEWLVEQRHVTLTYPGNNKIAFRAHKAIYEAIAARDPDRAERMVRSHLSHVSTAYWRAIHEAAAGAPPGEKPARGRKPGSAR